MGVAVGDRLALLSAAPSTWPGWDAVCMQQRRGATTLIFVGLIVGAVLIGVGIAGLVAAVPGAAWLVVIGTPVAVVAVYRFYLMRRRNGPPGAR